MGKRNDARRVIDNGTGRGIERPDMHSDGSDKGPGYPGRST